MNYNSNELFNIKGNVIFITGAGRGIGQTVALGFASSGAKVACFDLNKKSQAPRPPRNVSLMR